jgi:hypothetical protein
MWRILIFVLAALSALGVISLDEHWYAIFALGGQTGHYVPFFWRLP